MSKLRADKGTSDRSREGETKPQWSNLKIEMLKIYTTHKTVLFASPSHNILLKYPEKWTNYVIKLLQVFCKTKGIFGVITSETSDQ